MLNSNALYVSQCIATDLVHVSYEPSRFSPFSLRSRHFHSPFYEHSTLFRRAKISTKLHANTTPILRNLATSPSHPVCDSSHDVTLRICHLSRDNSKRREPVREETKVMENIPASWLSMLPCGIANDQPCPVLWIHLLPLYATPRSFLQPVATKKEARQK